MFIIIYKYLWLQVKMEKIFSCTKKKNVLKYEYFINEQSLGILKLRVNTLYHHDDRYFFCCQNWKCK